MADNLTPEEIAALAESLASYRKAQDSAKDATERLKDAQERFGKQLGRSAADLGSSLYKGEKGVGQFGNAVESAASALQMLILAIPGIGLAMKALAVTIGAVGKAFNAASKQGDALYKTYQDLGRAGATAADGITGVFRNMQNLGYGIEELDKMVALVTQNSETLAKFSMTAADGTNAFAQGMAQIQRDGQLRLLGKTTDDINAAGAAFVRQQVSSGRSQKDIGDSLGVRTKAYILELDRLQRLTGTSADALQKQQDEAMAEDAYNQVVAELEARAASGDKVAEAQLSKIKSVMAQLGPEMQKEFQRGLGGDVSAQQKMFMAMPSLMQNVMDENVSTSKTMNDAQKDAANALRVLGPSFKLAADSTREMIGPAQELRKFELGARDYDERNKAAAENAKVLDNNTKRLTEAQIANMNSRDAMQAFINQGIAPATVALNAMAKAASGAAGLAAGAVGAPTGGAAKSSPPGMGKMDYGKELYGTGAASLGNLRVKSPEAYSGGETSQQLMTVAQAIQDKLGGDLRYFSAFNDSYERGANSLHGKGRALDFTLTDPSKAAAVAAMIQSIPGISKVIDEYANPSRSATGGHIHAEVSAANGAILSGPMSGYKPNLTMHGTEAIVPLTNAMSQAMSGVGFSNQDAAGIMTSQLDKLDELVRIMQNQVSVSTKILQAAT
jgi:hypothetical protein